MSLEVEGVRSESPRTLSASDSANYLDLFSMIGFCFPFGHESVRTVSISPRSDAPTDDDRSPCRLMVRAKFLQQMDRAAVCFRQCLGRVAEPSSPVRAGPPCCALQNKPET